MIGQAHRRLQVLLRVRLGRVRGARRTGDPRPERRRRPPDAQSACHRHHQQPLTRHDSPLEKVPIKHGEGSARQADDTREARCRQQDCTSMRSLLPRFAVRSSGRAQPDIAYRQRFPWPSSLLRQTNEEAAWPRMVPLIFVRRSGGTSESLQAAAVALCAERGSCAAASRSHRAGSGCRAQPPVDPLVTRRQELTLPWRKSPSAISAANCSPRECKRCSALGPIDPEVAFVGPAPGPEEDAQGEPSFCREGRATSRPHHRGVWVHAGTRVLSSTRSNRRLPKNRLPTNRSA